MKKILLGLAVLVVLLVVLVLAAPFLIPMGTYKAQIERAAREATGRELVIAGDLRLSLLPRIEVAASKVALANAPGAREPQMATLERLLLQLKLWPLLRGKVEIDRFVLVDPVIHLEVDQSGRPNWQFTRSPATATPGKTEEPGVGLPAVSLGDVRLEHGRLTYRDARTARAIEVSDIDTKVLLPSLDAPFRVEGALVWNGERVTLTVAGGALDGLLAHKSTRLEVTVAAAPVRLVYAGDLTLAEPLRAGGKVELDVPSVRKLAAWVGTPLQAPGTGLGPLKIEGTVTVAGSTYAFQDARLALDALQARGDVRLDAGGPRPAVSARLDVDQLDLNPYLPPPDQAPPPGDKSGSAGAAAPAGWSEEPIDLSGLRSADAELLLSVGGIRVRDIKVGRSALAVSLRDGLLVANLNELALYQGSGTGRTAIDARGQVPAVEQALALHGVAAEPLLRDAAGFERLEGTAQLDLSLATRGSSQRAMVEALSGRGAFTFTNGAIKGVNIAAMARNVKSAFLAPGASSAEKTDFAELSGTFRIVNGVLRNDDLRLLNPLLRLHGAGTANLPARTLSYRLEPRVVSSLKGQGGAADVAGVTVPVIIEGPWHALVYRPDLAALAGEALRSPEETVKGAEKTLKKLFGR